MKLTRLDGFISSSLCYRESTWQDEWQAAEDVQFARADRAAQATRRALGCAVAGDDEHRGTACPGSWVRQATAMLNRAAFALFRNDYLLIYPLEAGTSMEALHEDKRMNVGRELKGVPVLATHSDEKLGEVIEARIHPTEGRLVALVVHTLSGEIRTIFGTDLSFEEGAARVAARALLQTDENHLKAGAYFTPEEITGALVITDLGRLLGRVSEVHMSVETRRIYYRVVKSEWQRLMGGGFLMPGDVPRSYFHCNHRLIVPADTEGRYAARPLPKTA